jgi:hypothetical protein
MTTSTSSGELPDRCPVLSGTVGVAVFDANCLFSKHLRYLLVGFAVYGVARGRWSRKLLEETAANLAGKLRGDSLEDLGRWIKNETNLVRDGLVTGYERWIDRFELPDTSDAAIECGATTIVTANLRDFRAEVLQPFKIEVTDPDTFVMRCMDANPVVAARLIEEAPLPHRLLDRLENEIPLSIARMRALLS